MSDSAVLQEVDEAVRKDDLKLWWNRYGTLVVAGAVAVVVVAAGAVGCGPRWARLEDRFSGWGGAHGEAA